MNHKNQVAAAATAMITAAHRAMSKYSRTAGERFAHHSASIEIGVRSAMLGSYSGGIDAWFPSDLGNCHLLPQIVAVIATPLYPVAMTATPDKLIAELNEARETGAFHPDMLREAADLIARLTASAEDVAVDVLVATIENAEDSWTALLGNHAHRTREARDECMADRCDGEFVPNGYSFTAHVPSRTEHTAAAILAAGFRRVV